MDGEATDVKPLRYPRLELHPLLFWGELSIVSTHFQIVLRKHDNNCCQTPLMPWLWSMSTSERSSLQIIVRESVSANEKARARHSNVMQHAEACTPLWPHSSSETVITHSAYKRMWLHPMRTIRRLVMQVPAVRLTVSVRTVHVTPNISDGPRMSLGGVKAT